MRYHFSVKDEKAECIFEWNICDNASYYGINDKGSMSKTCPIRNQGILLDVKG